MWDWYRRHRARANAWKADGGLDGYGLDLEDDRPWWKKMTEPYEPETDESERILAAYNAAGRPLLSKDIEAS